MKIKKLNEYAAARRRNPNTGETIMSHDNKKRLIDYVKSKRIPPGGINIHDGDYDTIPPFIDKDQLEYLKDLISDILISNDMNNNIKFETERRWVNDPIKGGYRGIFKAYIDNSLFPISMGYMRSNYIDKDTKEVSIKIKELSDNMKISYDLNTVFVSLVNRLISMGYDVIGFRSSPYSIYIAADIEGKLI